LGSLTSCHIKKTQYANASYYPRWVFFALHDAIYKNPSFQNRIFTS
jgi:hypothetical protein